MPLADELLDHASRLLSAPAVANVDCRRAVSSSYYAVFHLLSDAAGTQVSPPTPLGMSGRIQRLLNHGPMREAMIPFGDSKKWNTFSTNLGIPCIFSPDLAVIVNAYANLQDARHLADYDVIDANGSVDLSWASDCLNKAKLAFDAWNRIKSTDEARLFLATLIFGVKWANRTKQP
ncbi:MAG: hypothetical protein WAN35_08430 [Terracidiphilus sp.]